MVGMMLLLGLVVTPIQANMGSNAIHVPTTGRVDFETIELVDTTPRDGESLFSVANNRIWLDFSGAADLIEPGSITIRELLADGEFGPDLSIHFTFKVDDSTITMSEVGEILKHRAWYEIKHDLDWSAMEPFVLHLVLQVGDANNDGRVLPNDLSQINAEWPGGLPFICYRGCRTDIDGDRRLLPIDLRCANDHMPSLRVSKPTGH
ncbi:MAG: hypothetical protein ACPGXK_09380 [Phycisphaerae bacterium]